MFLLLGKLFEQAKVEIQDTYPLKKGYSRSKHKAKDCSEKDEPEKKRLRIDAKERKMEKESLQKQISVIEDQIRIKQRRIDQGKGNADFKLCDELTDKVRALMREKYELNKQFAILEKSEAKSKWYHKKKVSKKCGFNSKFINRDCI